MDMHGLVAHALIALGVAGCTASTQIGLDPPEPPTTYIVPAPSTSITLTIAGETSIVANDTALTIGSLGPQLRGLGAGPDTQIILYSSRSVRYQTVLALLAEIRAAGFSSVTITSAP